MLAALGTGTVTLKGALWSEDTEAMVDCMKRGADGSGTCRGQDIRR